jgi:hypothetical protein
MHIDSYAPLTSGTRTTTHNGKVKLEIHVATKITSAAIILLLYNNIVLLHTFVNGFYA